MTKNAADDEARRKRIDIRGELSKVPCFVRAEWRNGSVLVTIDPHNDGKNVPRDIETIKSDIGKVLDREEIRPFAPDYRFKVESPK